MFCNDNISMVLNLWNLKINKDKTMKYVTSLIELILLNYYK